ncbi:MAG: Txe/YoeB family addiction module toxin, partial [Verrucomicrobiota bacterium]
GSPFNFPLAPQSCFGQECRRINIQHRLFYQVYMAEKTVKVIRMWTHYE